MEYVITGVLCSVSCVAAIVAIVAFALRHAFTDWLR